MKDARGENGHNRQANRLLVLFACLFAAILLVSGAITMIVDPFFHYHAPLSWFPYQIDNKLSQNPGMALHFDYDSVITGSSMTVNFHTNDFRDLMGLNTIKLSYDGATPRDIANCLEKVYGRSGTGKTPHAGALHEEALHEEAEKIKAVFIPVDILTYTAGTDEVKYDLPEYLYDNNPFNDVEYLWNKDVLLDYIAAPLVFRWQRTDPDFVYGMDWLTPEMFGEVYVMSNYVPAAERDAAMPEDAFLAGTESNLEINILPYVRKHPETTFYFFFPPVSRLFWEDISREQSLDARLTQCRTLSETLLQYDNVKLFSFHDAMDIVTDLDNYTDSIHFSEEVSHWMAECFASGQRQISAGDIDGMLENLRLLAQQ